MSDHPSALDHKDGAATMLPNERGEMGWIGRMNWTLPWALAIAGILITILLSG